MKKVVLSIVAASLTLLSCKEAKKEVVKPIVEQPVKKEVVYDVNQPATLIKAVADATGGYDNLYALNDVQFDYSYIHPDGQKDVSVERYIFEGEVSWAKYSTHQINAAPTLKGDFVQFRKGDVATVALDGKSLEDPKLIGTAQFLRHANYMWFTMMFKLTDSGLVYEYNGQETIDGTNYDVVTVTYDKAATGKAADDIYKVHINPTTKLVDSFYFSLPAFGINAPVLFAKLTYTEIDGIQVITRRQMFKPSADGKGKEPMVDQLTENVKFNNGFTAEGLSKSI